MPALARLTRRRWCAAAACRIRSYARSCQFRPSRCRADWSPDELRPGGRRTNRLVRVNPVGSSESPDPSWLPDPAEYALLVDLLDRPAVKAAWDDGPALWRSVWPDFAHHGEDEPVDEEDDFFFTAAEVAALVGIESCDIGDFAELEAHWTVRVSDELQPFLDLDLEELVDPTVAVLSGHPSVAHVEHGSREEWHVCVDAPLVLEEVASLAARGLIANHLDALRRNDQYKGR